MDQLTIRPAADRGRTRLDWLDSRHTFSFADYYDPRQQGFGALRVINEDRVAAGRGFGTHPHRDMEILTWVLAGELVHKDSLGNGSIIRTGELQRMSAGTGVLHSERNGSPSDEVHFLQIWILPERARLAPGYEQRAFAPAELANRLRLIGARDGRDGAVTIHQDVDLYAGRFGAGQAASFALRAGRHAWLQVAHGAVSLDGRALAAGDGAAVAGPAELAIAATAPSEVLLFDLA